MSADCALAGRSTSALVVHASAATSSVLLTACFAPGGKRIATTVRPSMAAHMTRAPFRTPAQMCQKKGRAHTNLT
jgi:hypothetical protein